MSALRCVCSTPPPSQPSVSAESQDAVQARTVHKTLYSPTFRNPLLENDKPAPQIHRHQFLKQQDDFAITVRLLCTSFYNDVLVSSVVYLLSVLYKNLLRK